MIKDHKVTEIEKGNRMSEQQHQLSGSHNIDPFTRVWSYDAMTDRTFRIQVLLSRSLVSIIRTTGLPFGLIVLRHGDDGGDHKPVLIRYGHYQSLPHVEYRCNCPQIVRQALIETTYSAVNKETSKPVQWRTSYHTACHRQFLPSRAQRPHRRNSSATHITSSYSSSDDGDLWRNQSTSSCLWHGLTWQMAQTHWDLCMSICQERLAMTSDVERLRNLILMPDV